MEEKRGGVPKRKVGEKEADINFIIPLFLKGKGLAEIVGKLQALREYPVTYASVYRDIGKELKRWQKERTDMIDVQMDVDLKKIDRLEATYWDAWEQSCKAKVKTIAKERSIYDKKKKERIGDLTAQEAQKHVTETVGDKKWLEGVQWCIEQRAKLLQYSKNTPQAPIDDAAVVGELVFVTRSRKNNVEYTDAIEVKETDGDIGQKLLQS